MAKIVIGKRTNWLTVFFFQLCVICNNIFGVDEQLFVISKVMTFAFFGVVTLRILYKGKVQFNHILLLPILFTVYCAATVLWAYSPSTALTQMITQVQLFILLIFTFWAINDGVTVLDYVKAIYLSGFGLMIFLIVKEGGPGQYINAMLAGQRMGEGDANTFGMVFGNAALCAAYYMILKGKKTHLLWLILFSFFVFSTASRKALLMVVLGVLAMTVMHYGWKRMYWTLLAAAAIVVAMYWVMQLPVFGKIGERFTNLLTGEQDASDIERHRMIEFGLQLFKEKPIHGWGISNFEKLYYMDTYSHNNFIELLVSGGVIALVLYYLMILLPVVGLWMSKPKGQKLDALHLMLFVRVGVELMFSVALVQIYNKNSWLLIGVLMAESVRANGQKHALQRSEYETDS